MNLYTCLAQNKHLIHYFAKEENQLKMPQVWVCCKKDKFYLCGNHLFLNHYVPNRKFTRHSEKAFSTLYSLQITFESLTEKEKKKLGLLHPSGKEYPLNMIYMNSYFTPEKKVVKNENKKG